MEAKILNIATPVPKTAEKIQLTESQQAAFNGLLEFALGKTDYEMALLEGYAGTGKSTLIAQLLEELEGEDMRIAIAAPTNKAVKVMREKLGDDSAPFAFGSIHSFLGLKMTEKEDGSQECKPEGSPTIHDYDLIVIDECSMIGTMIYQHIVHGKRHCKVLFIGDPCQLPPVGEETSSPVFNFVTYKYVLNEVVRQARENPIIALSMAIRQFIAMDQPVSYQAIMQHLPPMSENSNAVATVGGEGTLTSWAIYELKEGRDARIIAFTNAQVKKLNNVIHMALHGITTGQFALGEIAMVHTACTAYEYDPEIEFEIRTANKADLITNEELRVIEILNEEHPFYPGLWTQRLILQREDSSLITLWNPVYPEQAEAMIGQYFNEFRKNKQAEQDALKLGDTTAADKFHLASKEASKKGWMMRGAFPTLRHIYAITAHKSQGSTFDTALVDFNDLRKIKKAFDFNRALYVAVTRPRSFLAVVV